MNRARSSEPAGNGSSSFQKPARGWLTASMGIVPPRPDCTRACWFCVACVEPVRTGTGPRPGVVESRGLHLAASEELLELGRGRWGRPGRASEAENRAARVLDFRAGAGRRGVLDSTSRRPHQGANTPSYRRVIYLLMVSRRGLHRTGRKVLVKPLVVLAAKCLGPGRLRLEIVKLAHDLGQLDDTLQSLAGRPQENVLPAHEAPARRAA